MKASISITAMASLSALGCQPEEIWKHYKSPHHYLERDTIAGTSEFMGSLSEQAGKPLEALRKSSRKWSKLDASVLFAVLISRTALEKAGWKKGEEIGVSLGSSRGATELFENYHEEFIRNGSTSALASPSTTLGNLSSWVAQDLQVRGPEISHSVTCSTALHSILNAVAWIGAGMAQKFLVGGTEAALTPFTFAQMKAMKVLAQEGAGTAYPCQALNLSKTKNSMVLGEGAAIFCLEKGSAPNALARITGIGYATEKLRHAASISAEGKAFQLAMKMALGGIPPEEVDAVVMHAPGTVKGDLAEMEALKQVFGKDLPALTTNKWKLGHTFGASGALSLEMAVLMLQHQEFLPVPYLEREVKPRKLQNILVNAVGFGGNAASILVSAP